MVYQELVTKSGRHWISGEVGHATCGGMLIKNENNHTIVAIRFDLESLNILGKAILSTIEQCLLVATSIRNIAGAKSSTRLKVALTLQ